MGKKIIIPGADFSANGFENNYVNMKFTVQDGYYQSSTGIFFEDGSEWVAGIVSNWHSFKVSCASGKQYYFQCKKNAKLRIVWFNSSDEYLGNDIITDSTPFTASQNGYFAINAAQIPSSPDKSNELPVSVTKEELESGILIMVS